MRPLTLQYYAILYQSSQDFIEVRFHHLDYSANPLANIILTIRNSLLIACGILPRPNLIAQSLPLNNISREIGSST